MKVDVEKLRSALAALGHSEEEIESLIAEIEAKEEGEDKSDKAEGKDEESSTSGDESKEGEGEGKGEEGAGSSEGEEGALPPEEGGVVPPDSVPTDVPPAEIPPEGEVPPVEEGGEVPPVPAPEVPPVVSLEEFEQVKADLEETKKALEGIKAQNEALLQALKSAGVISGDAVASVGHDQPSIPNQKNSDDTMDSILAEINRKGY